MPQNKTRLAEKMVTTVSPSASSSIVFIIIIILIIISINNAQHRSIDRLLSYRFACLPCSLPVHCAHINININIGIGIGIFMHTPATHISASGVGEDTEEHPAVMTLASVLRTNNFRLRQLTIEVQEC
jgi:hypothetical protein